jgi:hypothetical protein
MLDTNLALTGVGISWAKEVVINAATNRIISAKILLINLLLELTMALE